LIVSFSLPSPTYMECKIYPCEFNIGLEKKPYLIFTISVEKKLEYHGKDHTTLVCFLF